jgi:hypothetical protein
MTNENKRSVHTKANKISTQERDRATRRYKELTIKNGEIITKNILNELDRAIADLENPEKKNAKTPFAVLLSP